MSSDEAEVKSPTTPPAAPTSDADAAPAAPERKAKRRGGGGGKRARATRRAEAAPPAEEDEDRDEGDEGAAADEAEIAASGVVPDDTGRRVRKFVSRFRAQVAREIKAISRDPRAAARAADDEAPSGDAAVRDAADFFAAGTVARPDAYVTELELYERYRAWNIRNRRPNPPAKRGAFTKALRAALGKRARVSVVYVKGVAPVDLAPPSP